MRAVKAHLGTSPFATHQPRSRERSGGSERTGRRRATATSDPAAQHTTTLTVGRPVVCYWRGCSSGASARISFRTPSLLAGEARDYCPRHTKQVAHQPGTAILGRLHVQPPDPTSSGR